MESLTLFNWSSYLWRAGDYFFYFFCFVIIAIQPRKALKTNFFFHKVTDDWDRRCLSHLVDKFYSEKVLEPGHTLSSDGIYRPPPADFTFADVKAYVENLPASDSPDLVGMHTEAQIAYLETQTKNVLETIVLMQPRQGVGGFAKSSSGDEFILSMSDDILKKLPPKVDEGGGENKLLTLSEILQVSYIISIK